MKLRVVHSVLGSEDQEAVLEVDRFGDGFALIRDETVEVPGHEGVILEVGLVDGWPACVAVRSDGETPLTGALLREIRISRLLAGHLRFKGVVRVQEGPNGELYGTPARVNAGPFGWPADDSSVEGFRRGKPRSADDEHQRVAEAYRLAIAQGRSTQEAVAEACGVEWSTARKKIMRARKAGVLGPAPGQRRKGEQR